MVCEFWVLDCPNTNAKKQSTTGEHCRGKSHVPHGFGNKASDYLQVATWSHDHEAAAPSRLLDPVAVQ